MQLDTEMAQVQRRQHAAVGLRRQQHADRLAEEADAFDAPVAVGAPQFEQALAGGHPGTVGVHASTS